MTTKIALKDLVYVCLHEAGHAVATYAVGGSVELVEILTEHAKARGRARANRPANQAQTIAAAGFAVEYLLFQANRLVAEDGTPLLEKAFIDASMNNATEDKISFFGSDQMQPDGMWPAEHDRAYMDFAIRHVAPLLRPKFAEIEKLALALESQGKVEQKQIEHILGLRGDGAWQSNVHP